jgi:hypothetical protein
MDHMSPLQVAKALSDIIAGIRNGNVISRMKVAGHLRKIANEISFEPSQLFSQVLLHGFDLSQPIDKALQALDEYIVKNNITDADLIERATQFTERNYGNFT